MLFFFDTENQFEVSKLLITASKRHFEEFWKIRNFELFILFRISEKSFPEIKIFSRNILIYWIIANQLDMLFGNNVDIYFCMGIQLYKTLCDYLLKCALSTQENYTVFKCINCWMTLMDNMVSETMNWFHEWNNEKLFPAGVGR